MSKKYQIEVEETVKYCHTLQIIVDDDVNVDSMLDELEQHGDHPDDIAYYLNGDKGVKILNFIKDESGECSFEVPDMEEVEE